MSGFDLAYQEWSLWVWWLHAFAVYALLGFVYFWFRLQGLEKAARQGMPRAVQRYNRALQGFPNAVYAKMMGKRPLIGAF